MPFQSQAQSRAAFGGYLGPSMKEKAQTWAHETPGGIKSLPMHKKAAQRSAILKRMSRKPASMPDRDKDQM